MVSEADEPFETTREVRRPHGEMSIGTAVDELYSQLVAAEDGTAVVKQYTSGIDALDGLVGGLRPGEVTVYAAMTGMGKSALALTTALAVGLSGNAPVLFVSLEMTANDLAIRTASGILELNSKSIRDAQVSKAKLSQSHMQALSLLGRKLGNVVELVCKGDITVAEIGAKVKAMQAHAGVSLVVVDYLQLVRSDVGRGSNREREVADVSRKLKMMAMDLNVAVIALSQLNRKAGECEEPDTELLRESGSLGQDASNVVFIWPVDTEKKGPSNRAYLVVTKSRAGALGKVSVGFDGPTTRFFDLEVPDDPAPENHWTSDERGNFDAQ